MNIFLKKWMKREKIIFEKIKILKNLIGKIIKNKNEQKKFGKILGN